MCSMDDIDRLLAKLDANHDQQLSPTSRDQLPQSSAPLQSLDSLLSQLAEGEKQAVRAELSKHPPKPPISQARTERSPTVPSSSNTFLDISSVSTSRSEDDPLVTQLKSEYEAQRRAERLQQEQDRQAAELQQQRAAQEKQRRLETLKAERRAALTEQAQEWLKGLQPRSDEGLWFDEFACNYESRLEAAIEYLEALQSVERESRGSRP